MSYWMEYVYMQKPKPTNTTGAPVEIVVIYANGNYRNIGTATSDDSGVFSFAWQPDIAGEYKVIATFKGSESYLPSSSETAFIVDEAVSTATQQFQVELPPIESYFAMATSAIIVAIVLVG